MKEQKRCSALLWDFISITINIPIPSSAAFTSEHIYIYDEQFYAFSVFGDVPEREQKDIQNVELGTNNVCDLVCSVFD